MNYFVIFCFIVQVIVAQQEAWTWHYHKVLENQCPSAKDKRELLFSKVDVPLFSQLLFSWNALRPRKSHYSFFVQVRDAATKKWGAWHKMIDWGHGLQRSYSTLSDGMSRYFHVRLETEGSRMADAFKVKVSNIAGDFSNIKSVTINISNMSRFEPELIAYHKLPSVYIADVPALSQIALLHEKCRTMCSPTSCSMLLGYLTKKSINPLHFAESSFDQGLNVYGSWPFNTAHAFELSNGAFQFYVGRLHSFAQLHKHLMSGTPVVVSVRGDIVGAPKVYNNGHLLVVVGFDAKKGVVICHDPAENEDCQTVKNYPIGSFVRAWERSRRLSYIAAPELK